VIVIDPVWILRGGPKEAVAFVQIPPKAKEFTLYITGPHNLHEKWREILNATLTPILALTNAI